MTTSQSAPVAPIVEPPGAFANVAPGIYRCSASSLTNSLPPAPKGWRQTARRDEGKASARLQRPPAITSSSSSSSSGNGANSGDARTGLGILDGVSNSVKSNASQSQATGVDSFLTSLKLRTILFLAPERKPSSLAAWCDQKDVRLIHLGLGALADKHGTGNGTNGQLHTSTALFAPPSTVAGAPSADASTTACSGQSLWQLQGSTTASTDMMSLERIAKDSLEILLDKRNLPCLICDMSGVSETGVVVGCLRRMQRLNFAGIRLEYQSFAGNRSRSSHERFIEMFDTDLISLPNVEDLPFWFVEQLAEDEEQERIVRAS